MRQAVWLMVCDICGQSETLPDTETGRWREFPHPEYPEGLDVCGTCYASSDKATKLLLAVLRELKLEA